MSQIRPTSQLLPSIGWKEFVSLPALGKAQLVAKIDTGAKSAALHAENITVRGHHVSFELIANDKLWRCRAPVESFKRIKSSNGMSEIRVVIETEIELGLHRFSAQITLTDRADMGVPMLLGRNVIKNRFLVNAARSFMLKKRKVSK